LARPLVVSPVVLLPGVPFVEALCRFNHVRANTHTHTHTQRAKVTAIPNVGYAAGGKRHFAISRKDLGDVDDHVLGVGVAGKDALDHAIVSLARLERRSGVHSREVVPQLRNADLHIHSELSEHT
jgi:hypothetical protein